MNFGFPVTYPSDEGYDAFAYYGAWQGHHQLWTEDETIFDDGTEVVEETWDEATAGAVFTTRSFPGVVTRRSVTPATL